MSTTSTVGLLETYRPEPGRSDELTRPDGTVRAQWAGLLAGYERLGLAELHRRSEQIDLALERDGVTYNSGRAVDPRRPHQPWGLDPLPLVVPADEWAALEAGVAQRAQLLDLVLADLYGPRRLLRERLLPIEPILSDTAFLRAADGIAIPGGHQLVVAACDTARGPDDRWVALGHRTQAPSGAAYAIENRRVLSRVFPRLYRSAEVHRLAPFVRSLRSALQRAAPPGVEDPSIVILSPGPLSETAFEHASIAAMLGYPLVQGIDLEVRDGRVWLRTVDELASVDVILRRVDAWYCDPLELRADSTLGIPGLVDACRTGAVSVVNPLGAGVLENAVMTGALPSLCRALLDTDLILPGVESWWCGDDDARSHVLANLGSIMVRPASRGDGAHTVDTTTCTRADLEALRARILAAPASWVGEQRIEPSCAPVLTPRGVEPRTSVVRTFSVAAVSGYDVMPGGLARAAPTMGSGPVTNRAGALSKDIWILGATPEPSTDFWLRDADLPRVSRASALSPRAAEHLFWLGRYAERAEAAVRLLRVVNGRRDEFEGTPAGPGPAALASLYDALTRTTRTFPGFVAPDDGPIDARTELLSLVTDDTRPGSVAHAVRHLFDAIEIVRDQLSVDTWLVVGSLERELAKVSRPEAGSEDEDLVSPVLDALLAGLLSLSGLMAESMVRDHGWRFMDAGRRIERAENLLTLVGAALADERSAPVESIVLESVLATAESIITYRRRSRSRAQISSALDLVVRDTTNPRSVAFQLDALARDLRELTASHLGGTRAIELVAEAIELVSVTAPDVLAAPDEHGRRVRLDGFVVDVRERLWRTSDAITRATFARIMPQRSIFGAAGTHARQR